MPIKTLKGIGGVTKYIASDKGRIENHRESGIFHNISSIEIEGIIEEFQRNYQLYARKRINSNKAVHVVLSMSPLERDRMTPEKMDDIVRTYLEKAYPNALAYGNLHQAKHYHSHLIISPNDVSSERSTRFSLRELKRIHLEMIAYVREKYPELATHIDTNHWGKRLQSSKEYFREKRNPSLKQAKHELSGKIHDIFNSAESSKDFYDQLRGMGYSTYNFRGEVKGIHWGENNQKMRFERLGIDQSKIKELDSQFVEMEEISLENERLQELDDIRAIPESQFQETDHEFGDVDKL